jgi:hypothetical protein
MILRVLSSFLLLAIILPACDHGLEPPQENRRTAIRGTITYQNWPPPDSLIDLRIVAFKEYPPQDIFYEVVNGQAIVYPPISAAVGLPRNNLEFYDYTMDLPAGNYAYLVVAQQYGANITTDWRAVGQYDTTGTGLDSIPTSIVLDENQILDSIDIRVDFHALPYQPFGH